MNSNLYLVQHAKMNYERSRENNRQKPVNQVKKGILDTTLKTQSIKEQTDKLDLIKTPALQKTLLRDEKVGHRVRENICKSCI